VPAGTKQLVDRVVNSHLVTRVYSIVGGKEFKPAGVVLERQENGRRQSMWQDRFKEKNSR